MAKKPIPLSSADARPRVTMRERGGRVEWRGGTAGGAWQNASTMYDALCEAVGEQGAMQPAVIIWEGSAE